jgi:putative acetyltransferase
LSHLSSTERPEKSISPTSDSRLMIVRRFESADGPRVCEIFYRSVHEVASARYDQAQIQAWAPKVPDPEQWLQRLHDYDTFVTDNDLGETIGWIATSQEGYIDMLFCLPEAVGRGVAAGLYAEAERTALARGLTRLTAHASLLAQPFFVRHGWVIDSHETVVRNGVEIPRAVMSKPLQRVPHTNERLTLKRSSSEFADSFVVMRDAFMAAGENEWNGGAIIAHTNPAGYLDTLRSWSEGKNLPPNWCPADCYLIFSENVVIGQLDIRHPLTEHLKQYGGNIGYCVHPAYRNRGIATWALRLALEIIAAKGVTEALLTCAHDNAASIRVIEKCGGRRIADSTRRRYVISTEKEL